MKKFGGFFLKCLLWISCIFFLITGIIICGIAGMVFASVPTGFLCYRIYKRSRNQLAQHTGKLSDNGAELYLLEEKYILCACIADALAARTNDHNRPVAHSTIRLRTICTAVYIVVNFAILQLLYYRSLGVFLCCCLAFIYTVLFCRFSTLNVLCRAARKRPETDFDRLVQDTTFNALESPVCRQRATAGIAVFCLSLIAFIAMHVTAQWVYVPVDGGYQLERYRPGILADADLVIPETHNGQKVVSIGESAFAYQPQLLSVTIPNSVISIEREAFSGCAYLNNVRFSQSLQRIGVGAFSGCNFDTVTLPDSLTELLAESFQNCDELTQITIPQGVTEIRASTFYSCDALKTVRLHDGIVDIHANAFESCTALKTIQLPAGITEIHAYTFENCTSLESIDIPHGVTRIAAHAFYGCSSLKEASIPMSVIEIRSSAFRLCPNLKTVYVAQDTDIDVRAFKDSPTKVVRDALTSSQWSTAVEETQHKDVEVFYCIVSDSQPLVTYNGGKALLLFDDLSGRQELGDGESLEKVGDDAALIAYLETAQKAGVTHVQIGLISPSATEIAGTSRFVYYTWDITELIGHLQDEVATND